jgi:hypothetical protein
MVTVEEQEEREKGLEGSTTTPVRAAAAAVENLQAEDLLPKRKLMPKYHTSLRLPAWTTHHYLHKYEPAPWDVESIF